MVYKTHRKMDKMYFSRHFFSSPFFRHHFLDENKSFIFNPFLCIYSAHRFSAHSNYLSPTMVKTSMHNSMHNRKARRTMHLFRSLWATYQKKHGIVFPVPKTITQTTKYWDMSSTRRVVQRWNIRLQRHLRQNHGHQHVAIHLKLNDDLATKIMLFVGQPPCPLPLDTFDLCLEHVRSKKHFEGTPQAEKYTISEYTRNKYIAKRFTFQQEDA